MKNILILNNGYPSEHNMQYASYIKSIESCLFQAGMEVDLLVMDSGFSNKITKLINYLKYYIKIISKNFSKYDCIYINNYPYSFIPLLFNNTRNINIIIHWHGTDIFPESLRGRFLNELSYCFIPKYAFHMAPSNYFSSEVAKSLKLPIERIFVSPSGGVDVNSFIPVPKDKKGFHIGFASAVSSVKGFGLFKEMILDVERLDNYFGNELYFHFINYGTQANQYSEIFESNSRVIVHNPIPKEDMSSFYSEIDLLVMPTKRKGESLGLVSLEAMSCGVPVVGTDAFALKEYIINGISGERFKMDDYNDMISAIKTVIEADVAYQPREFIVKNYSMESVVKGYRDYFSEN